jgi:hypothetical protein
MCDSPVLAANHDADITKGDFRLLGQVFSYPKGWFQLLGALGFLGAVAFIAYLFFVRASPDSVIAVARFVDTFGKNTPGGFLVKTEGGTVVPEAQETVQFSFWTPSAKTESSWSPRDPKASTDFNADPSRQWMKVDDGRAKDFGDALLKKFGETGLNGYRRYEIWGQGRTDFKSGWWWTVSVKKYVHLEDLIAVYKEVWKPPASAPIYVEVTSPSAGAGYTAK